MMVLIILLLILLMTGVLQGDTLVPYLFIICIDYILRTAIPDATNGYELKSATVSRR